MKRIVSLVLALSMVMSMFTFSFAALEDVEGTKYEAAVEALAELRIVSGYEDGSFLPENKVTRAELAKLLVTAYGLEKAAEVAVGPTAFSDVAADYWATGYINVATDYGFINGYPEGTFAPANTVTYAEAVTMCLRVLGYTNEIEAKGTWPTNYMAKAQDLKLLKDVEYGNYNNGATRGNTALLIWNMLRTKMWEVTSESEGDGLQSNPNRYMLNVKFSDYAYAKEAEFQGYSIGYDSKAEKAVVNVVIKCNCEEEGCELSDTYKYAENDFYTFVPGTTVEVLINVEDKELLTLVPTGDEKLVEGTVEELVEEEEYDLVEGAEDADYIYGILSSGKVTTARTLNVSSVFVDKVAAKKDGIKINSETIREDSVWNKKLVLVDGERGSIRDVEVGDIITTVSVGSNGTNKPASTFYVVGSTEATGELTKYVVADARITVGGEKYTVSAETTYVENPEKTPVVAENFGQKAKDEMKGEEVVLKLDALLGKVVRIEFDGKIEGEAGDTSFKFMAVASNVIRDDEEDAFSIKLENENGVEPFLFADEEEVAEYANELWLAGSKAIRNTFAKVTFNDDGEVTAIDPVAKNTSAGASFDEAKVECEDYDYVMIENAEYDEDNARIKNAEDANDKIRVNDNVVVVRVVYDSDDKKTFVEFAEGLAAVEDLDGKEPALVIYEVDEEEKLPTARYVVITDEASDVSDNQVAIIESMYPNKIDSNKMDLELITDDGKVEITYDDSVSLESEIEKFELLVYKTETNSKDETVAKFVAGLKDTELDSEKSKAKHAYVAAAEDARTFKVSAEGLPEDTWFELDTKEERDVFEEAMFVIVTVSQKEGTQYEVDGFDVVDYDNVTVEKFDRISFRDYDIEKDEMTGANIIFVIRGMGEMEAAN